MEILSEALLREPMEADVRSATTMSMDVTTMDGGTLAAIMTVGDDAGGAHTTVLIAGP